MRTALSPRTTQRPFHICRSQMANLRLACVTLPNKKNKTPQALPLRAAWLVHLTDQRTHSDFRSSEKESLMLITSGQVVGD